MASENAVNFLSSWDIDLDIRDAEGLTPIYLAVSSGTPSHSLPNPFREFKSCPQTANQRCKQNNQRSRWQDSHTNCLGKWIHKHNDASWGWNTVWKVHKNWDYQGKSWAFKSIFIWVYRNHLCWWTDGGFVYHSICRILCLDCNLMASIWNDFVFLFVFLANGSWFLKT